MAEPHETRTSEAGLPDEARSPAAERTPAGPGGVVRRVPAEGSPYATPEQADTEGTPLVPSTLSLGTASAWARTATVVEGADEEGAPSLLNERLSLLGEGAQGRVYLVRHLGQLEAHKLLSRRKQKSVFREALHTRLVNHPNIVKVFGAEETDGAVCLRMEYIDGRDLARVVADEGVLQVAELAPLAIQVADALHAAHEAGVVHQDLKPSNLILHRDRQRVVVTDFGVSAALRSTEGRRTRRAGTPIFMAPELLEGRSGATPRADVWSLGVTLYYLACGSYPFAFDSLSPTEAVRHPPRDPRPDAPHVSGAFWAIIERMLLRELASAYGSMAEVRDALIDYVERVSCPACGERVDLAAVERNCPACAATRIAPWVDMLQSRRKAETEFARCEFEAAAQRLDAAARTGRAAGFEPEAEELAALATIAKERRRECRAAVRRIREDLEDERLVEGIAELERSWTRFSRSPELKALRNDRDRALARLYHETEPRAARELRHGAFDAARAVLERLRRVHADPTAQRALEHAIGGPPDDFAWLEEEIERKERVFGALSVEAREALERFDFERALGALGRIEDEFPSEANLELMQRLRRGNEALQIARPCPPAVLEALRADPLAPLSPEWLPLELQAAARACSELLESFPIAEHPSFAALTDERAQLLAATGAIQDAVLAKLDEATRAEDERRIRDALTALESVRERMFESDVFGTDERDALDQRVAQLRERSDRAAELYREGLEAKQRRIHAKALLVLQEVMRIAPNDYPDAPVLAAEIETLRDRSTALAEQVTKEFAEIRRGRFTPESACAILTQSESLWELSEDTRRERLAADMGEVVAVLIDSQHQYLETQPRLGPLEISAFLRTALVPLARSLSESRWLAIHAEHETVQRGLSRTAGHGLQALSGLPFAEALAAVESRIAALEPLAPALAASDAEPPERSFGVEAAAELVASFRRAAPAERKLRAAGLMRALRDLRTFTPRPALSLYDSHVDRARRLSMRAAWKRNVLQGARLVLYLAPLAGVGLAAWTYGHRNGVQAVEREVRAEQRADLDGLEFGTRERALLERWLWIGDSLRPAPDRIALLEDWRRLRSALAPGADPSAGPPPASAPTGRTAPRPLAAALFGLAAQRSKLSDPGLSGVLARLDQDLARAADAALAEALEDALATHGAQRRPGDLVLLGLTDELDRLAAMAEPRSELELALAGFRERLSLAVRQALPAALDAGLADGTLAKRCADLATSFAAPDRAPPFASQATREALTEYLERELERLLVERLERLWTRGQSGAVASFRPHLAQLVDALALCFDTLDPRTRPPLDPEHPVDRVLATLDPDAEWVAAPEAEPELPR